MLGDKEQLVGPVTTEPAKARPRPQIDGVLCLLTGLNHQRQKPLIRRSRLIQRGKAGSLKEAETLTRTGGLVREPDQETTDPLLQALLDARAVGTAEALRNLSGHLVSIQEAERQRIARELHDDLSQRMAMLSIELQQLDQAMPKQKSGLRPCVRDLWVKAQEISAEINRLSYQLHPPKLEHLGLVAAVQDFCAGLSAHQPLGVEFRAQGFPAAVPKDVALCVYRVVQESLHNVVKHSGARTATVELTKSEHAIHLRVCDQGRGFDVASAVSTGGLGLLSMRERLRLVGGELSVRSHPSHGTEINASVPLVRPA